MNHKEHELQDDNAVLGDTATLKSGTYEAVPQPSISCDGCSGRDDDNSCLKLPYGCAQSDEFDNWFIWIKIS